MTSRDKNRSEKKTSPGALFHRVMDFRGQSFSVRLRRKKFSSENFFRRLTTIFLFSDFCRAVPPRLVMSLRIKFFFIASLCKKIFRRLAKIVLPPKSRRVWTFGQKRDFSPGSTFRANAVAFRCLLLKGGRSHTT